MSTVELTFRLPASLHEFLIAELDELGCDCFMQDDDELRAYLQEDEWSPEKESLIQQWFQFQHLPFNQELQFIPDQDWNEPWEQSIEPILTDRFIIRPSWAKRELPDHAGLIDVIIDPKMSFGTGHHETTQLILQVLPNYVREGDRVLDAGTGTSILAIASVMIGASSVIAFDVDDWAYQNALENIEKNRVVSQVDVRLGAIDVVSEETFDVIVANINRNVLLDYSASLVSKLAQGGYLILSGLLKTDHSQIKGTYEAKNVSEVGYRDLGEWCCCVYQRIGTIN